MKYAVVAIDMPTGQIARMQGAWPAFQNATESLQPKSESTKKAGPNCWLIQLESDTGLLASVVNSAQEFGISHTVLYFRDEPSIYSSPAA